MRALDEIFACPVVNCTGRREYGAAACPKHTSPACVCMHERSEHSGITSSGACHFRLGGGYTCPCGRYRKPKVAR